MFRSPGTIVKQFMSEMAQVEKEDAGFGLSPARETVILLCGPQLFHL